MKCDLAAENFPSPHQHRVVSLWKPQSPSEATKSASKSFRAFYRLKCPRCVECVRRVPSFGTILLGISFSNPESLTVIELEKNTLQVRANPRKGVGCGVLNYQRKCSATAGNSCRTLGGPILVASRERLRHEPADPS